MDMDLMMKITCKAWNKREKKRLKSPSLKALFNLCKPNAKGSGKIIYFSKKCEVA